MSHPIKFAPAHCELFSTFCTGENGFEWDPFHKRKLSQSKRIWIATLMFKAMHAFSVFFFFFLNKRLAQCYTIKSSWF